MKNPTPLAVFAASIDQAAHDLNNLCTSLLGFAELAGDALAPGSRERYYLQEVAGSGREAIALADRLREIAEDLRRADLA